jgi:hypothetical protein
MAAFAFIPLRRYCNKKKNKKKKAIATVLRECGFTFAHSGNTISCPSAIKST